MVKVEEVSKQQESDLGEEKKYDIALYLVHKLQSLTHLCAADLTATG